MEIYKNKLKERLRRCESKGGLERCFLNETSPIQCEKAIKVGTIDTGYEYKCRIYGERLAQSVGYIKVD